MSSNTSYMYLPNDENRPITPPQEIKKKTYVCGQTSCKCPRTSNNKIHCRDYPKSWPCYNKICRCFVK